MGVFEDLAKSAEDPRIPDNTRLIEAIGDAEIGGGDAYSNMFTALTDARDAFSNRRSDKVALQLAAAPNKAARDAILADAQQGFNLLNPKILSEAMAEGETRDLARSADKLARDTFGLKQEQFGEDKRAAKVEEGFRGKEVDFAEAELGIDQAKLVEEQLTGKSTRKTAEQTRTLALKDHERQRKEFRLQRSLLAKQIKNEKNKSKIAVLKEEQRLLEVKRKNQEFENNKALKALTLEVDTADKTQKLKNIKDKKVVRQQALNFKKTPLSGDLSADIKAFKLVREGYEGRLVSKENLALLNPQRNRLFNKVRKEFFGDKELATNNFVSNKILEIIGLPLTDAKGESNISSVPIKEYTVEVKQLLEQAILAELQKPGMFDWMSEEQLKPQVDAIMKEAEHAKIKFGKTAKQVALTTNLEDRSIQGVIERNEIDVKDTNALHRRPIIKIKEEVMSRLKDVVNFDQYLIERLSDSIQNTFSKVTKALPKLDKAGKQQLNLAILDLYRQVDYDSNLGFTKLADSFVLTTIDKEKDVSDLKIYQILNRLQDSFPASDTLGKDWIGNQIETAIKTDAPPSSKDFIEEEEGDATLNQTKGSGPILDNLRPKSAVDRYRQDIGEAPFDARHIIPDLLGVSEAHLRTKFSDNPTVAATTKQKIDLANALKITENEQQKKASQELENQKIIELLEKYKKGGNYRPKYQKKTPSSQFYR